MLNLKNTFSSACPSQRGYLQSDSKRLDSSTFTKEDFKDKRLSLNVECIRRWDIWIHKAILFFSLIYKAAILLQNTCWRLTVSVMNKRTKSADLSVYTLLNQQQLHYLQVKCPVSSDLFTKMLILNNTSYIKNYIAIGISFILPEARRPALASGDIM